MSYLIFNILHFYFAKLVFMFEGESVKKMFWLFGFYKLHHI